MGKKKTEEVPVADNKPDEDSDEEDTPVVKALKEIDDKYCKIEVEFEHEVEMLKKKFYERQAPLLQERTKVLNATDGCGEEDKKFGTPACRGFWLQAMQNNDEFADVLEEWDEPVLQYLEDITQCNLDDEAPEKGFKLELFFKENPYFSNKTLFAEIHTDYDPETYKPYLECDCTEMKASEIKWEAGKNVTVELIAKKVKGGGAKKAAKKGKAKEEARASFFRLFFRNFKVGDKIPEDLAELMGVPTDGDDEEVGQMLLNQIMGIAQEIHGQIIPFAVRFYTGDAGDADDDSDDEDEESESEEDDDDEESSDDEPPRGRGAAKKKPQQKDGSKPAAGEKQEECKQQ